MAVYQALAATCLYFRNVALERKNEERSSWKRDRDWRSSLDAGSVNDGASRCGLAMDQMDAMQADEGGRVWVEQERGSSL